MANTLYSLKSSHPALAVRAMLDRKGIDYKVVNLVPGMHPPVLRLRGFKGGTVPAIKLGDRKVQGSREIDRALDEVQPDPPLFPADADARRRVEDAERWGEQELQNASRRIFRWMTAHSYDVRRWLAVDASGVPLGGLLARPPVQARQFARKSGADDATVRADLAGLPDMLAEVQRLHDEGVIGGDDPNAADFQIASSVNQFAMMGDLAPYLEGHPLVRWAETVAQPPPRPSPKALPAEWLAPLEPLRS